MTFLCCIYPNQVVWQTQGVFKILFTLKASLQFRVPQLELTKPHQLSPPRSKVNQKPSSSDSGSGWLRGVLEEELLRKIYNTSKSLWIIYFIRTCRNLIVPYDIVDSWPFWPTKPTVPYGFPLIILRNCQVDEEPHHRHCLDIGNGWKPYKEKR